MVNPEKEVPCQELCEILKKLGYPQEGGGWYWAKWYEDDDHSLMFSDDGRIFHDVIDGEIIPLRAPVEKTKAPTSPEIERFFSEALTKIKNNQCCYVLFDDGLNVEVVREFVSRGSIEANALAKMLIKNIHKGRIRFTKEEEK